MPANSTPGEGSVPGLQTAALSLCPPTVERERTRPFSLTFCSYKATVLLDMGFTLMTSLDLNYLLKTLSPDTVTLAVRVSTCDLEGGEWFSPKHDPPLNTMRCNIPSRHGLRLQDAM